jgi:hypothetical protein
MRQNGLGKLYERLTPEERFRLDVLASARGDAEESELLTRTCQRETYTMNHRGYTGRWTGAYELTLRMYIAVNNELAKLQMIDAVRGLVPYSQTLSHNMIFEGYFCGHESGSRYAWGRAGKDGEPPGYEEDIEESEENADPATEADMDGLEATVEEYLGFVPEVLDRLERSLASDALSLWIALRASCTVDHRSCMYQQSVLELLAHLRPPHNLYGPQKLHAWCHVVAFRAPSVLMGEAKPLSHRRMLSVRILRSWPTKTPSSKRRWTTSRKPDSASERLRAS